MTHTHVHRGNSTPPNLMKIVLGHAEHESGLISFITIISNVKKYIEKNKRYRKYFHYSRYHHSFFDYVLAFFRVGLHTILSVMSSVPEQLKEVVAEVGRATQQEHQREPNSHEETRKVITDTGDTLHTLLTGLQEAVTHLKEEQDQATALQKEALKKVS